MNFPSDKGKEHDINWASKKFQKKAIYPDKITNNQKYPNNKGKETKKYIEINENFPNNNEIFIQISDSEIYTY